MNRRIIAYALVLGLVSAGEVLVHGDEDHGKKGKKPADGHATAIG